MRLSIGVVMLALALTPGRPAFGQTAAPASGSAVCDARETTLGGIGRVTVFAFTGPVFGGRVCATVANLASDLITARVAAAATDDALVTAALTGGGDVSAPVGDMSVTGAGPYVIAPGGVIPAFGADTAELPRVVLAYAGQRTFLIATTPIALVDLAKELRTQPGAFGADAFERAVILASGPDATLSLRTAVGT
ncbi:MAG: hypothetical protein QOF71_918, partial [Candidatus Eremiobacteraeota bacterium]|nr:hypothetical protein [Candidatus Eremiobacteraeota bacterium]